jgi:hypothetical protein
MSKLKDKLSANMRMVKAHQQPAEPAKAASDKPAAKPAAEKPAAPSKPLAGEVPQSGTALFPTRIWPD